MTLPATIRVVAYAVVQNRQLLMVRKRHTTKFMFPGGKFGPGETDIEAIQREVQEELCCQVVLESIEFLGEFVTLAANEANTKLIARVYTGELIGEPVPSNEIEEIRWLNHPQNPEGLVLAPLLKDCIVPRLQELQRL